MCVHTCVPGEWSGREVNLAAVTEAQRSEVGREGTGREQRHFCPEPWISSGGQNTTGLGIHPGWNHPAGDRKPWVTGSRDTFLGELGKSCTPLQGRPYLQRPYPRVLSSRFSSPPPPTPGDCHLRPDAAALTLRAPGSARQICDLLFR